MLMKHTCNTMQKWLPILFRIVVCKIQWTLNIPKYIEKQWSGINTITSHIPTSIPKGKEGHTQNLTNAHERHVQLTEWIALSQTGGYSATCTLIENVSNIYFYLFSILNYKIEKKRKHNGQLNSNYKYIKINILVQEGSLRKMLKILWKRGEIAPEEQFLLLSTIFCYLMLELMLNSDQIFSSR